MSKKKSSTNLEIKNNRNLEKLKTREERFQEVMKIREKLTSLGLSTEINGIKEFYEQCKEYVNQGYSWSGKIKLLGTKRILQANLTIRKNVECSINLKYNVNV